MKNASSDNAGAGVFWHIKSNLLQLLCEILSTIQPAHFFFYLIGRIDSAAFDIFHTFCNFCVKLFLCEISHDKRLVCRAFHNFQTLFVLQIVERGISGVLRGITQHIFQPQKLVVLGDAVGSGQRTGLDLAGI